MGKPPELSVFTKNNFEALLYCVAVAKVPLEVLRATESEIGQDIRTDVKTSEFICTVFLTDRLTVTGFQRHAGDVQQGFSFSGTVAGDDNTNLFPRTVKFCFDKVFAFVDAPDFADIVSKEKFLQFPEHLCYSHHLRPEFFGTPGENLFLTVKNGAVTVKTVTFGPHIHGQKHHGTHLVFRGETEVGNRLLVSSPMEGLRHKPYPHFRFADAAGKMTTDRTHGTALFATDGITVHHEDVSRWTEYEMITRIVGQSQHRMMRIDRRKTLTQFTGDGKFSRRIFIGDIPAEQCRMTADFIGSEAEIRHSL